MSKSFPACAREKRTNLRAMARESSSHMDFWRVQHVKLLNVHKDTLSRCPLHTTHIKRRCMERHFGQTGGVSLYLSHRSDENQSTTRRVMLANEIFLQNALRKKFSCPIRGLDRFAENSNIPWNQPNIFHPNQIAEVPRMHLLSRCVLVALQYHLSETDEALKNNDTTTDLHKSLQCPANCLYYSLVGWVWDREMFEDSFPFPEKSLFYVE